MSLLSSRRGLLLGGVGAVLAGEAVFAQTPNPADAGGPPIEGLVASLGVDGAEVVELWPGGPPGAPISLPMERIVQRRTGHHPDRAISGVVRPRMTVFRPTAPSTGAALLLMPGGGYIREAFDTEGAEVARRFCAKGATCFVLTYRLPGDGWAAGPDAPLQDAQRAMRLIRQGASRCGIDPARVGAIGFSAGGHLCAMLATRFAARTGAPGEELQAPRSARPDFAGLMYALISLQPSVTRPHSALMGAAPTAEQLALHSAELQVSADTPPCFIAQAADDPAVPLENAFLMFHALKARAIPTELHIFQSSGHGFGVRPAADNTASQWPELFTRWAAQNGFRV